MPNLSQLLYISKAAPGAADDAVLRAITAASERNNQADAISGRLVLTRDAFVQVCEGPRNRLTALLGRLMQDPRHSDVRVCHFVPVKQRIFGDFLFSVAVNEPDVPLCQASFETLRGWSSVQLLSDIARTAPSDDYCITCQVYDDARQIVV